MKILFSIAQHGDREGRRWLLEDLGSTNGTYLKIRGRCRLESGDILLCGSQLLRVR